MHDDIKTLRRRVHDEKYPTNLDGACDCIDTVNEFGHYLQLLDLYNSADSAKVMYGYCSAGTTKRALHADDIAGIKYIYGSASPTRIIGLSGDLNFGNVAVGSSATRALNISNTGNSTLTISSISFPVGFSGNWSGDINPGGSQAVNVTFTPTSATSYGGTITVNSNKTSGANTIACSGTGGGSPAGLTVTSPNGGEVWAPGTSHAITWNSTGLSGYLKIELLKGNTAVRTISLSTSVSSGSRTWVISSTQTPGTDYRIRITSTSDATKTDISDAYFTIGSGTPPPTTTSTSVITVTYPNGGESWPIGTSRNITWSSSSPTGYVRIELSRDGGASWSTITASTANDGSRSWIATSPATSQARIRITSTSDGSKSDTSDGNFTIGGTSPPTTSTSSKSITVTSPNGGEVWAPGTMHPVTWTSTGLTGYVRIELLKGEAVVRTISTATSMGTGTRSWTVSTTQAPGADYRIRIRSISDTSVSDVSNSYFTISSGTPPPTSTSGITVTSPNGGESWAPGTMHTITWSAPGLSGYVRIELLKGSSVVRTISSGTLASIGVRSWTILTTQSPGSDYRVRITSITNASISDVSNGYFSIGNGSPPPTTTVTTDINVTSPNGGESWDVGSLHYITWNTGGIGGNVKIELSRDGGASWSTITASTNNDGSRSWSASSPNTSQARIRITSTSDGSKSDTSDGNFTIEGGSALPSPPTTTTSAFINLITPNGGENWEIGTEHIIAWTSPGNLNMVSIDVSYDGGATWCGMYTGTNHGSQTWPVMGPPTTRAKIRVYPAGTGGAGDASDDNFTISGTGSMIIISTPNGGETWPIGSSRGILWGSVNLYGDLNIDLSLDGGTTWSRLVSITDNNHVLYLTVPGPASDRARIRISSVLNADIYDVSDGNFTITPYNPSSITISSPNGGELWGIGTSHNITWTTTAVADNMIIYLSRNGGSTWEEIARNTLNDGTFTWNVTGPSTTQALIKMTTMNDINLIDISNGVFVIF